MLQRADPFREVVDLERRIEPSEEVREQIGQRRLRRVAPLERLAAERLRIAADLPIPRCRTERTPPPLRESAQPPRLDHPAREQPAAPFAIQQLDDPPLPLPPHAAAMDVIDQNVLRDPPGI